MSEPALSAPARPRRFGGDRGIAIGPILFASAMLAVLGAAMAYGTGAMTGSSNSTRVQMSLQAQANLIRQKVTECYMGTQGNLGAGWPTSAASGTAIDAVTCPGDGLNLWAGSRAATIPAPPQGFNAWTYVNLGTSSGHPCGNAPAAGGICIYTQPTAATTDINVIDGMTKATAKFSSTEASWTNSGNQRFSVWIIRN